jgi:hypothetical protein
MPWTGLRHPKNAEQALPTASKRPRVARSRIRGPFDSGAPPPAPPKCPRRSAYAKNTLMAGRALTYCRIRPLGRERVERKGAGCTLLFVVASAIRAGVRGCVHGAGVARGALRGNEMGGVAAQRRRVVEERVPGSCRHAADTLLASRSCSGSAGEVEDLFFKWPGDFSYSPTRVSYSPTLLERRRAGARGSAPPPARLPPPPRARRPLRPNGHALCASDAARRCAPLARRHHRAKLQPVPGGGGAHLAQPTHPCTPSASSTSPMRST